MSSSWNVEDDARARAEMKERRNTPSEMYFKAHNAYKHALATKRNEAEIAARLDMIKYVENSSKIGNSFVSYSMATTEMGEYIRGYARSQGFQVKGEGREVHIEWSAAPPSEEVKAMNTGKRTAVDRNGFVSKKFKKHEDAVAYHKIVGGRIVDLDPALHCDYACLRSGCSGQCDHWEVCP